MSKGVVSVVVPIYNVEKYLDRCLTSIVNQTYRNLEIILVDDGSPDGCPLLCDQWARKDSRIKVIHKTNAGLGMARNTGIENATGEYICFFDSDDYVDEQTIEKAYSVAQKENADTVVFGCTRVRKDGAFLAVTSPMSRKSSYRGEEVQNIFLPDLLECGIREAKIRNLCLSAWACLFSMDLLKRTRWRFVSERKIISEDSHSLVLMYKDVSCVAVLPEPLYFYCENGASLTQTYRADRYEKLKYFYTETLAQAERIGYSEELRCRIASLFFSYAIGAMKQTAAAELKKIERKKLLAQIVDDELMQTALQNIPYTYNSVAKRILFNAMRRKKSGLVFLLVTLWNMKNG